MPCLLAAYYHGAGGREKTYKTPKLMRMIKLILIRSFRCRFQNRIVGNRARKRSLAVFTATLLAAQTDGRKQKREKLTG